MEYRCALARGAIDSVKHQTMQVNVKVRWILHQRNATAGATAVRLTHVEFEKMVDDRLLKRGHADATQRGTLVTQIREAATDRLVFLVGNTAKEIGFEIRDLKGPCQMYLTRRETIELRHL